MIKAAYVVSDELKNVTDDDAQKLDIINIAFAHCRNAALYYAQEETLSHLPRLKEANPSLRILFSVGGWGSGGFSTMSSSEETRKRFACSCLDAVKRYNLDGIDIDWEYPCLDWADIDASPDDRVNYTLMLKALRDVFDAYSPGLLLTVAVGNDNYFIDHTEMDKVAPILNYVSLMTYDMRGCGDRVTGHHANLYMPKNHLLPRAHRSVENSVRIYHEAGVPLEKLVIGIACYSRMWRGLSSSEKNGLWQKASPGDYGPTYGEIEKNYMNQNGFVKYWDEECKAPYLTDGKTFISFDDEDSVKEKCRYAMKNALCGVMYWEHSCDPNRVLLNAICEAEKE